MIRVAYLVILLLMTLPTRAERRVSCTFCHQPLTEALRTIEMLSGGDLTINFSYSKLEDYTVTTTITAATPVEAVRQVVGFYPIKVSEHGTVIVVQPMAECHGKVIGRLVSDEREGVGFASVHLLTADSAVIAKGVSNERGDFVIPVSDTKPKILRASCIGYHTAYRLVTDDNTGDIVMSVSPMMLDALAATADRRVITNDGSVMRIRVAGTPYAQIGTFADLLGSLPMETASVPGSGSATVYYLNGREIVDPEQLALLRTSDISAIIIDKAPGAQYPADATMVVSITTLRNSADRVYLNIANITDVRNRVSDMPSVDFRMQSRGFTTQMGYRYDYLRADYDEYVTRRLDHITCNFDLRRNRATVTTDKTHRLNWSGELQCDKHNRLGMYVYYTKNSATAALSGIDNIQIYYPLTSNVSQSTGRISRDDGAQSHILSGALTYDFSNSWLSVHLSHGLLKSKQDLSGSIIENIDHSVAPRTEHANIDYRGMNTNADLSVKLPWMMSLSAGWRRSYIKTNNDKYFYNVSWANSNHVTSADHTLKGNLMHVAETDNQTYVAINQRFGRWVIVAGGRLQWVSRDIRDDMNDYMLTGPAIDMLDGETTYYKKSHLNLLPSLSVRYATDDAALTFDYMRRISHPAFRMLNSGVIYEDSLTLCLSNSHLESTVTDELRISGANGNLSADIGWTHIKNPIGEVEAMYVLSDGYLDRPAYRGPVNLDGYSMFTVNAAYGTTQGRLRYYGAAGLNVPVCGSEARVKSLPWLDLRLNITYRLCRHSSLYIDYKLLTAGRWEVYERQALNRLNAGVTASICSGRLHVTLEGTDLLASNRNGALTTHYRGTVSSRSGRGDQRGLSLRIAYTLFNKPIRTVTSTTNTDILNRLD